jgi:hypothetical protein
MFVSCEKYNILWRDYSESNDDVVELHFRKGNKTRNIIIYKNQTRSFWVFNTSEFTGRTLPTNCSIAIYPFFSNNKTSEIFIYDIQVLEQTQSSITIAPRKDVVAYYADFYENNYCYTVISRDNKLDITDSQELKSVNEILNTLDSYDYTYKYEGEERYNGKIVCGYIVKGKIDNTFHWLRPEFWWERRGD